MYGPRTSGTWVSTTSVAYLSERYVIPQKLAGNLAVSDAVIEQAL